MKFVARFARKRGEEEVYRNWHFAAPNWSNAIQIAHGDLKKGEIVISLCLAGYHL